jgi:hypothetical protein
MFLYVVNSTNPHFKMSADSLIISANSQLQVVLKSYFCISENEENILNNINRILVSIAERKVQ